MADQLSLRLEADRLPDLPDLRPMQPRPLPAPFDSDDHLFEPITVRGDLCDGLADRASTNEQDTHQLARTS